MGIPVPPDEAFQEPEKKSGFLEFLSRLNPFKSSRTSKKESAPAVSGDGTDAGSSGVTIVEMERRLIEKQTVTEEDFNDLKRQRAKAVQDYLLKAGDLSEDRLFIVAPSSEEKSGGESQVTLALK